MGIEKIVDPFELLQSYEDLDYNDPLYKVLKNNMKAQAATEILFPFDAG